MFHCRQIDVLTLGAAPEFIRNSNVKMVSVPFTFKEKKNSKTHLIAKISNKRLQSYVPKSSPNWLNQFTLLPAA